MHSRESAGILLDYCARKLEPPDKAEVERHLEQCAACRQVVAAQRGLWDTLDQWAPPNVSMEFDARLYARIKQEEAAPSWTKWARRVFQPPIPVALWKPAVSLAALCAVLTVGLVVRTPAPVDHASQVRAESVDIEQVARTLDDLDLLTPASTM